MTRRLSSRRLLTSSLALALALAGCGGPKQEAPLQIGPKAIEIGPLQAAGSGTAGFSRVPLDAKDIEWITAFRVEPTVASAATRGWNADLRLANGTRLFAAAPGMPPIVFPAGFGMSVGQILRDTPEGWRRADLVGSVEEGLTPEDRMRVTLDAAPPRAQESKEGPSPLKRLYVLSLPLLDESIAEVPEPLADYHLLTDPRVYWQVPAGGRQVRTAKFSYLVPTDSTVHYVAAWHAGPIRSVKITDLADGKVLWHGEAPDGAIPPFSSANGFPLIREHEYEVEAVFENAGCAPESGAVALLVYYRPPGDEPFGYPFPPPGEEAAH